MKHWMTMAAALWLALAAAAHAGVLQQHDYLRPLGDISAEPLGPNEGVIVIAYAVRNMRTGVYSAWPVHIGWMPFDDATLARTGTKMIVATERCARNSKACRDIQYRVYRLPAGGYSLAWIFQDKLYGIAQFEKAEVAFGQGTHELVRAEFSDKAQSGRGAPAIRVIPGQANYVGDLLIQFRTDQPPRLAWAKRNEEEIGAMMKAAGYGEVLNFQGSRLGAGR